MRATIDNYPVRIRDAFMEAETMQLDCASVNLSAIRGFASPVRCPHCGDLMVAPVTSEFVAHGEIRHHWECEACGERSCTAIALDLE